MTKRFREGHNEVRDDTRSGRPVSDSRNSEKVMDVISCDRHKTIDEIADNVGLSQGTVYNILKDNLKMTKVCARWIPPVSSLLKTKKDLARMDFCVFPRLKSDLRGHRFN